MNLEILSGIPNVDLSKSKKVKSNGKEWLMIPCPFAKQTHSKGTDNSPSFGISEDGFFNCFSCKTSGKLSRLFRILEDLNGIDLSGRIKQAKSLELETVESILSPKKFREEPLILNEKALIWPSAVESTEAMEYLTRRGLNASKVKFWDIRYDSSKEMVVIPIRTFGLNGAYGRSIEGRRHHNYFGVKTSDCLGGYDKFSNQNRKTLVLEGFFDVINAFYVAMSKGFNCTCTFTSVCSDRQSELLSNTDSRLYCGYDCDKAGDKGWEGIVRRFPLSCRFRWKGPKDFGEMTTEQLEHILSV